MDQAPTMTLLQAIRTSDDVTPAPATAHAALRRLCAALAEALCIPRASLGAYAAELEAMAIQRMPTENEFVVTRPCDDRQGSLQQIPRNLSPLQVGLLGYLVSVYEGTPFTLQWIADSLLAGNVEQIREALIALQARGYVRYIEDDNALLVRSAP